MMHKWSPNMCFSLFSNCQLVLGFSRALICDLGRFKYHLIPISLAEILKYSFGKRKEDIFNKFKFNEHEVLNEYFAFLEENEFIFWHEENKSCLFPPINLSFETPYLIQNSILDINKNSTYNLLSVIENLGELNCPHIQIRSYDELKLNFFETICFTIQNMPFRNVEIISKWEDNLNLNLLEQLILETPKITSIELHSYKSDNINSNFEKIKYYKNVITSSNNCGVISNNYFNTNIKLFTEAQKHNTCLNRKISIDVNGEIKNCPSMAKSYGNIKDTTLQEAIEKPGFKDMWYINKDQVSVCKDCEFRYICTDCRAYVENPEDIYSKPLKCGYNPYTAEWEEWSTNPLKQKAIEFYGMQELVKK